jgi:integrase
MAFFPADPKTIRAIIEQCIVEQEKPATIRRYVATIARAHIAAGLLNPCASEPARLAHKEVGRVTSSRQRQALALGWAEIKEFLKIAGEGLRADRERALLCVAYDTMYRRSELVAFDFEDLEWLNSAGIEDGAIFRRLLARTASVIGFMRISKLLRAPVFRWINALGLDENRYGRFMLESCREALCVHVVSRD